MKEARQPYVLRFDGRVPAVRYYESKEEGIKARKKYRKEGYHVLLHKVVAPGLPTIGSIDGPAKPRSATAYQEKARRDYKSFLSRLSDRFRRRNK